MSPTLTKNKLGSDEMNLREWLFYTRHQRDPGTIFLQLHIARALRRKRQSNSQVCDGARGDGIFIWSG